MSFERPSHRIVIAGASSLLGAELKSLLEESRFAAADFRLLDEDLAAGTLTEAGGEAAVIQPVGEGSFDHAQFVFFTGSADFTRINAPAAQRAGAKIIDLSGALVAEPGTAAWFPTLDTLRGDALANQATVFAVPSAAATAASALLLALASIGLRRLAITFLQPVSEAGRAGIEELESQTSQLLSFQSVGKPVFDAQVAFSLLDRFGPESRQKLFSACDRLRAETRALLAGKVFMPAVQVIHAPVFYGATFSACAELDPSVKAAAIESTCKAAAFAINEDNGPSNISIAGESIIQLAVPQVDPAHLGAWWFWGAADNIRLPAVNAVKLADKLAS
jgi:aspartate-semialdehyde dehydrogenase